MPAGAKYSGGVEVVGSKQLTLVACRTTATSDRLERQVGSERLLIGFGVGASLPASLGTYSLYQFNVYVASLPPGEYVCGNGTLGPMFLIMFGAPILGLVGANQLDLTLDFTVNFSFSVRLIERPLSVSHRLFSCVYQIIPAKLERVNFNRFIKHAPRFLVGQSKRMVHAPNPPMASPPESGTSLTKMVLDKPSITSPNLVRLRT